MAPSSPRCSRHEASPLCTPHLSKQNKNGKPTGEQEDRLTTSFTLEAGTCKKAQEELEAGGSAPCPGCPQSLVAPSPVKNVMKMPITIAVLKSGLPWIPREVVAHSKNKLTNSFESVEPRGQGADSWPPSKQILMQFLWLCTTGPARCDDTFSSELGPSSKPECALPSLNGRF